MKSLLHEAGVKDALIEYIYNLGITAVALFSWVGISESEIRIRITEPYFATLPEQPTSLPVLVFTQATVLSALDDAKQVRTSPAAPPLPATQMAPEGPAPVAAYSANHSVLSTTLRPGQWAEQVEKYESSWSPRRSFPVKMFLGARSLHEANSSRMFTPVGLGEILKNRAYAANGQLNVLAQKKSEDKALGWRRTGDTAELVEANNQYVPKTQWAIIDGLEAVKWAYTWEAYGPDEVADMFIRPFVFFARQRPDELDGVCSLYEAASWELAILLRGGSTFDIAVSDVSSRTMWMREYLEDYRINNRRYSTASDGWLRRQRWVGSAATLFQRLGHRPLLLSASTWRVRSNPLFFDKWSRVVLFFSRL